MSKKIHFVCEGNTFRSRLAEAYLRSLNTDLIVTSSGIKASKNYNDPITVYSKEIAKREKIEKYLAPNWTQTTKEIIDSQDLVIFMKKIYYDFCFNELGCKIDKYLIWDIPDVFDYPNSKDVNYNNKVKIYTKNSFKSYALIKDQINKIKSKIAS